MSYLAGSYALSKKRSHKKNPDEARGPSGNPAEPERIGLMDQSAILFFIM